MREIETTCRAKNDKVSLLNTSTFTHESSAVVTMQHAPLQHNTRIRLHPHITKHTETIANSHAATHQLQILEPAVRIKVQTCVAATREFD